MSNMYSYTTMTLKDVIKVYPELLNNINLSTPERTANFKDMFISMYNTKSIGAETITLFQIWIENKFNEIKRYYESRLDIYEKELNGDEGRKIIRSENENNNAQTATTNSLTNSTNTNNNTVNYDLPRSTPIVEKATTKTSENDKLQIAENSTINSSGNGSKNIQEIITGDVNIIEQREKWLRYIRDIYRDMCQEFKDCFALIYA